METNLSKYIYKKLIDEAEDYYWKIIIDSHKNAVEIYFTIYLDLDNDMSIHVQDVNAQVNNSNNVYFENVVCLFNENENKIIPEAYLYAIPVNGEEGIEQGYIDAFLKQLNIIVTEARSKLRLFLDNPEQSEFSLLWNEDNFLNTINTLRKTNKYSKNKLNFSESKDQSFIEQLKEEQYDGMERV